jgi:hypothetical protein
MNKFIVFLIVKGSTVIGFYLFSSAGMSRVPFAMRSLDFSIDLDLPAALRPWG